MPVTLNANQCPLPVVDTALSKLSDAENTSGTNVNVARAFAAGNSVLSSKLNRNAKMLELLARYGGGGNAIANGLALSAGAGLTLNIAAGQAVIDGIVPDNSTETATTLAVPDSHPGPTDRVWVWLTRAGAISYTLTTTPPATNCCLLGSCTTASGAITAVDTSGVVYLYGGALYRETADLGPPTDTPDSALTLFTKTQGGVYFWDTTAHRPLYEPMQPNKLTISSSEAMDIEAGEQVILNTNLTPLTLDGTLTIDGELYL